MTGRLARFFRLSHRRRELEDRLLCLEYRNLLCDDFSLDGGEGELHDALDDLSRQLRCRSFRSRG